MNAAPVKERPLLNNDTRSHFTLLDTLGVYLTSLPVLSCDLASQAKPSPPWSLSRNEGAPLLAKCLGLLEWQQVGILRCPPHYGASGPRSDPAPHPVSSHELDILPLLVCCQPLRPRPPPPRLTRGQGERAPGTLDLPRPSQAEVRARAPGGHVLRCGLPSLLTGVPSLCLEGLGFLRVQHPRALAFPP